MVIAISEVNRSLVLFMLGMGMLKLTLPSQRWEIAHVGGDGVAIAALDRACGIEIEDKLVGISTRPTIGPGRERLTSLSSLRILRRSTSVAAVFNAATLDAASDCAHAPVPRSATRKAEDRACIVNEE